MDMNEKPKLLKKIKPVSNISNKIVVITLTSHPRHAIMIKKEVTPHDQ